MPRPHKPHRGRNAWKKDILRLTCLLRLRCSPPVPYHIIADLLIRTNAKVIGHLVRLLGPEDWKAGGEGGFGDGLRAETREWLVGYLEGVYTGAEMDKSIHWERVRDLEDAVVREKIAELGGGLMGDCEVVNGKECKLQNAWKTAGDWRVGSEPEPGTERGDIRRLKGTAQSADVDVTGHKEGTRLETEEEYSTEREQFFEDMVSRIVDDDDDCTPEPKRRRVMSLVVGGPKIETFGDEEVVWQPPKFDYPNSYRLNLEEGYLKILAQLKEVNQVINDCNWELYSLETKDLSPTTPELLQEIIPLLPDIRQPLSNIDFESSISDAEERCRTPSIIIEDVETPLTHWQECNGEDRAGTGSSLMMEAAAKAYEDWKGHRSTQGWLEMSR